MNWRSVGAGLILATMAGITTLGLGSSFYGWPHPLELFSHFQWQYWLLCVLLWVGLGLSRDWRGMALGLGCVGLLSTQILPWYGFPTSPPSAPAANPALRVLLANINTRNRAYQPVLDLIDQEDPDLVLLMEVSDHWLVPLQAVQPRLPFRFGQGGTYLFSRYPLQNPRADNFGTPGKAALFAQIQWQDQAVALIGSHPWPPLRPALFHSRNRHLNGVVHHVQALSQPVIFMGDLNITPWSPYYRRLVSLTGLTNTRRGFGLLPSWPTALIFPPGWGWAETLLGLPIDHCLVSPELQTRTIRLGPPINSDHRPVIVDLELQSPPG